MNFRRKTAAVGYFVLAVFFAFLSGAMMIGMSSLAGGYGTITFLVGGVFFFALLYRGMIAYLDDVTRIISEKKIWR